MERPIKFRAWHDGMMYEVYALVFNESGIAEAHMQNTQTRYRYHTNNPDTCVLMQFTGLLDKHGREIFEGDIIKDKRAFVWTVRWNRGLAQFAAHWHNAEKAGSNKEWRYWDSIAAPCVEVLGNIYENPKLVMKG